MKKLTSELLIKDLKLPVFLGWSLEERREEQTILLNVDMHFTTPPKACVTDNLRDSVCYDALIKAIHKKIRNKRFKLIEHLAHDIYHIILPLLPKKTRFVVSVTKHPQIEGLFGGVCFRYGNSA